VQDAFECVVCDILGPLPTTTRGNKFICVWSDYLTHWPECCAVPSIEAPVIACIFVDEIFTRHGAPRTFLSDRGSNFISALVKEVCCLLNTRKLNSTAYHPQTDGLVERFNNTLAASISMFVNPEQTDWDLFLPSILLAYHVSPCPFLLYG